MPSEENHIAPFDLPHRVSAIYKDYEAKTGVKLNVSPSWYKPTFLGAKDTPTRKAQILFLTKIANLETDKKSNSHAIDNLKQFRLLIALLHITQTDIKKHYTAPRVSSYGTLDGLIEDALMLKNNPLDDETLEECLLTLININLDTEINPLLAKDDQITQRDWDRLIKKARTQLSPLQKEGRSKGFCEKAMSTIGYFVGKPVGYGTGFVLGRLVGQSTLSIPLVSGLTWMFSSLFSISSRGPNGDRGRMGNMFYAGEYAREAASASCGVAGAMILGETCGYGLRKAGGALGYGLDVSLEKTAEGARYLVGLLKEAKNRPVRMGINLISGDPTFYNQRNEKIDINELTQQVKDHMEGTSADLVLTAEEEATVQQFIEKVATFSQNKEINTIEIRESSDEIPLEKQGLQLTP